MAKVAQAINRLLLISFDLPNPVPGDPRYRDVDRYLAFVGTVLRPLKQTRLVITPVSPTMILGSIRARIGIHGGVLVAGVSRRSEIFVSDSAMRAKVRRLIRQYGSR